MKNRPTISAIMIVKNEEDHLPRCLESIQKEVDEIVVVDTGSEDNSIEIAKSFGAKVFEHAWENHFSRHRNQSISYATGEWLFQIDADEELILDKISSLREAVENCHDVDCLLVTLESRWEGGRKSLHNSVRLFRNLPQIRYKGRVHNEVTGMETGRYAPIILRHYGYDSDEEIQKKKFKRTVNLLLMDKDDNPEDPRAYHYLGISYLSMNMLDEAVENAERAIQLCRLSNNLSDLYCGSYYVLSSAYMRLGDLDRAEFWATEAQKFYPMDSDSLFILSKIYFEKQDFPLFWRYADSFINRLDQLEKSGEEFGTFIFHSVGYKWLVHLYRACASFNECHKEKWKRELDLAYLSCDDKAHYHHLLAGYYMKKGEYTRSESEFKKALDESPQCPEIVWDFARLYKKINNIDRERDLLEKYLRIKNRDKYAFFSMGINRFKDGDFNNAGDFFERCLDIDHDHPEARVNLALVKRKQGDFEKAIEISSQVINKHPESLEAHSNLAFSYYSLGNYNRATHHFLEVDRLDPDQPDTHVFLSHIFLLKSDIESCVGSCDNLLRILNIKRDIVLNSLKDLGDRFLEISDSLKFHEKSYLSKVCLEIARTLIQASPQN